jgi:3-phosphoshikimate 1-carboxyvinyltransferase
MSSSLNVHQKSTIRGSIKIPGDKSISHRAVMFASLANGTSTFKNFLSGEDCFSTVNAFRQMGINVTIQKDHAIIRGKGIDGLCAPNAPLNLGNSGTTMRLLSGILAAQKFNVTLYGDNSLQNRPMGRIIDPLRKMGAQINGTGDNDTAPLLIEGKDIHGITYVEKRGSAQVKSCILLAGLYAKGSTTIIEEKPSRDHTERMCSLFHIPLNRVENKITISPVTDFPPQSATIPSDISSAAFFVVAALILQKSDIELHNIGLNPTRSAFLGVLQAMGADISVEVNTNDYEPTGTIKVRSSALHGIAIDPSLIPFIIDELPILMIAASCASGETSITGARELRVKETDRLQAMAIGLRKLGFLIDEFEDGMTIQGKKEIIGGETIDSFHDHRIAMSFAVLALKTHKGLKIKNHTCVDISFPSFFNILEKHTQ